MKCVECGNEVDKELEPTPEELTDGATPVCQNCLESAVLKAVVDITALNKATNTYEAEIRVKDIPHYTFS